MTVFRPCRPCRGLHAPAPPQAFAHAQAWAHVWRRPCARSLVAGHYLPLADNPGVAPGPDQTRSLQSDQGTLLKITWKNPRLSIGMLSSAFEGPSRPFPRNAVNRMPGVASGPRWRRGAEPYWSTASTGNARSGRAVARGRFT